MRNRFWIVLGLLTVTALATLGWISTSLVFFQALASDQNDQIPIIFGSAAKGLTVNPFVTRLEQLVVPQEGRDISALFSRFVYTQAGDQKTIIGLGYALQAVPAGWHTRQLGWITVLSSPEEFQFSQAKIGRILQVIGGIAMNNILPNPTVIVQGQVGSDSKALAGKLQDKQFAFRYGVGIEKQLQLPLTYLQQVPDNLSVALPSFFLDKISGRARDSIENTLIADLALVKARPDLLKYLRSGQTFGLIRTHNGLNRPAATAVGVSGGSEQFARALDSWVAREQGYVSPIKRSFRLPDGTIGREYIPLPDAVSGFTAPGMDGCASSNIADRQLWRCERSDTVTLGTSSDITRSLLNDLIANVFQKSQRGISWRIQLPAADASAIPPALGIEVGADSLAGVVLEGTSEDGQGVLIFK